MWINRSAWREMYRFSILSGFLVLLVGGLGVSDMSIYKPMTPDHLMPGTLSQDLFSLLSVVVLILVVRLVEAGQQKLWIVWLGLQAYFAYAYGLYAFEAVLNHLYFLYLAIFGLSVFASGRFFVHLHTDALLDRLTLRFPPRVLSAYFMVLVLIFLGLWTSILIPAMDSHERPDGLTIFVFDLALVLPFITYAAYLLCLRRSSGFFLGAIILVKMATLGLSVLLGELLRPMFGQSLDGPGVLVFSILGLGGLILAGVVLHRLELPDAPMGATHQPQ